MYGNAPNPRVRFHYRRLRCGDWWDEDPCSPTYNSFQHVACGRTPPFAGGTPGMWEQPRALPLPRGDRVQHEAGGAGPRFRDLPSRADGRADDGCVQPALAELVLCSAGSGPRDAR